MVLFLIKILLLYVLIVLRDILPILQVNLFVMHVLLVDIRLFLDIQHVLIVLLDITTLLLLLQLAPPVL